MDMTAEPTSIDWPRKNMMGEPEKSVQRPISPSSVGQRAVCFLLRLCRKVGRAIQAVS